MAAELNSAQYHPDFREKTCWSHVPSHVSNSVVLPLLQSSDESFVESDDSVPGEEVDDEDGVGCAFPESAPACSRRRPDRRRGHLRHWRTYAREVDGTRAGVPGVCPFAQEDGTRTICQHQLRLRDPSCLPLPVWRMFPSVSSIKCQCVKCQLHC